jgi:predicted phage baseplate assembly protein
VIQVRPASGWENWTRVDDLALAGPDDPFYALDPVAGTVTFGDGVHGRMPLPGEAIRVLGYRYGGGVAGNAGAGGISRVRGASLQATNPLPAEGGQDAETTAQAQARIPLTLRARDRAVCSEDFSQIALETPGVQVGRAQVLPRHKPQERADGIPGVVTLIVLPAYDPVRPDTPTPDREMLRKVCAWLEPRRLVTTELYVTPPEYVPVDIAVAVQPEPGMGEETLRRWVELALRQYFAPLPPYGPDGSGWPFGRAVRDRDAEAAALRVQGVQLLNDIKVQGTTIAADGTQTGVTGSVAMQKWQLPVVRQVAVALGPTAPPLGPEPSPPVNGIPVPVTQGKC